MISVTGTNPEIFIADSESSSVRRLALATGQVSTLCGGDRNPLVCTYCSFRVHVKYLIAVLTRFYIDSTIIL